MTPIDSSETMSRHRVSGDLAVAVFIGTYPGLTRAILDYMTETITKILPTH